MGVYDGFIDSTYVASSNVIDASRTINLQLEKSEIGNAKTKAALVHTPGYTVLTTLPLGPVWALWSAPTATSVTSGYYLYALAGPLGSNLHLYKITGSGSYTDLGQLGASGGYAAGFPWGRTYPPKLVGDVQRLLVAGGGLQYPSILTFAGGISDLVSPTGYPGPGAWTSSNIDTYFFSANVSQFTPISTLCASNQNDASTWNALNILASQDGPDLVMELASLRRELWVFGMNRTVPYYDAGNATFPFSRVPGAVMKVGCLAPRSVVEMSGSLFFLGTEAGNIMNSGAGLGAVYRTNGYNCERISTFGIEQLIASWTNPDQAMAFTYQHRGHTYYVLNGASGATTNGCVVYDQTTGAWHERTSPWTTNNCYAPQCYTYAFGRHLVGSAVDGKILALSGNTYTDNGSAITRTRIGPPIATENLWNFYNSFALDCEVGTQASGNQTVTLSWSNDGGQTFNAGTARTISASGNYTGRALWLRLGKARSRVFKVTTTDQMPICWLQAFIDATAGNA